MVNAIPETATLESYVRGKTFDAIISENKKINRALIGAALSLGANVEIIDAPGYSPLVNSSDMIDLAEDALKLAAPELPFVRTGGYSSGSTDMGDLSCIMPVIHPYAPGSKGKGHGNDYEIADPVSACVTNAKWQVAMLKLLLENEGKRAYKIIEGFNPQFTKEEFLAYQDSINRCGDRIVYEDNGAKVIL